MPPSLAPNDAALAAAVDARLWSLAGPSLRGTRPSLDRMRRLLAALGEPQRDLPVVHVGGTSGKGSTCCLIAAILEAAGYRAGLHTKPHLQWVGERMTVAGAPISPAELAALLDDVAPAVDAVIAGGIRPSWFELVVALALLWFRRTDAAPVVVEVGLGGTWDATNVLQPLVSVLTNVGLDHMDVLGDTVEAIAADKVGILKPGAVAVTGATQPSVLRIVEERAAAVGAPLWRLGRELRLTATAVTPGGGEFDLALPGRAFTGLRIAALGRHQLANAALAVAAVCALAPAGYAISDEAIRQGLAACRIPGRLEIVPGAPPLLLDGAHNPDKMAALAAALREVFPDVAPVVIAAMRRGHDPRATLAPLMGVARQLVLTALATTSDWGAEQSVDPHELQASIADLPGCPVEVEPDALVALDRARALAGRGGLVCATGSLYLVGLLRERVG